MKPTTERSRFSKTGPSSIKNSFPIPNMLHRPRVTHLKVKVGKRSNVKKNFGLKNFGAAGLKK
jgi:hypothetical protein